MAGGHDDWDRFYDALISIGQQSCDLPEVVLWLVFEKLDPGPDIRDEASTRGAVGVVVPDAAAVVELVSWDESSETLVNRAARLWDNANRRPSHADHRRTMALQILRAEFPATRPATPETQKYFTLVESLIALCT